MINEQVRESTFNHRNVWNFYIRAYALSRDGLSTMEKYVMGVKSNFRIGILEMGEPVNVKGGH